MAEQKDFDIDIDQLQFKAINEGLGFHQNNTNKKVIHTTPTRSIQNTKVERTSMRETVAHYSLPTNQIANKEIPRLVLPVSIIEANFFLRIGAWAVDWILLNVYYAILVGLLFVISSGISNRVIDPLFLLNSLWRFLLMIYGLIYLLYFSIFDLDQTFGKKLLNIKVKGKDSELTYTASLLRSIITLTSPVFLFVTLILDFQNKLTDSYVGEHQ